MDDQCYHESYTQLISRGNTSIFAGPFTTLLYPAFTLQNADYLDIQSVHIL